MNDLPELPFEKVLSYLSLEERLKARAVSRRWYNTINSFKVKTLFYSERPRDFIYGKSQWISGAFAKNFISSIRFESFFKVYSRSVLSNLKHLRLCDLSLDLENRTAFVRTLKSFGQLEELDIVRAKCSRPRTFKLNLPMVSRIHLEFLVGFKKLTLDAPKLRTVRLLNKRSGPFAVLNLVHGDSVENLTIYDLAHLTQNTKKKLTNLEYLYVGDLRKIDPTFLSDLKQLKEVQLLYSYNIERLFQQKQRYGRADLKIYLSGWLLNGPDDLAISFNCSEIFYCLTEVCPSRVADVIPFWDILSYSVLEPVTLRSPIDILKRFTRLFHIIVDFPVQDIQRFLDLLKNSENCYVVDFNGVQPQELFDRLPDHCAIQRLKIDSEISDVRFLSRLKNLIHLEVRCCQFDAESIRRLFEKLKFLCYLGFRCLNGKVESLCMIETYIHSKRFRVWVHFRSEEVVPDLNAAIQFITNPEAFMN